MFIYSLMTGEFIMTSIKQSASNIILGDLIYYQDRWYKVVKSLSNHIDTVAMLLAGSDGSVKFVVASGNCIIPTIKSN